MIKSVELLVEEVGKLVLRCDIMERIMKFKASSPKDAENKMEAIWEKFPHASVIEYPDERLDGIYMTVMLDKIELNKGGEDMDCDGKVINGVCDCHTHNCCPAVDGRSKLHPNCPHKEWVVGYRLFYTRVMSQKAREDYMANGI